ncbi:retrovirus-related pol polyprotein from transposon TNT 1-94 [Tanacetum coccineum]
MEKIWTSKSCEEKKLFDNTTKEARALLDDEAEAFHMILNGIGNYICSITDAFPNAKEIWIAIGNLGSECSVPITTLTRMVKNSVTQFLDELEVADELAKERSLLDFRGAPDGCGIALSPNISGSSSPVTRPRVLRAFVNSGFVHLYLSFKKAKLHGVETRHYFDHETKRAPVGNWELLELADVGVFRLDEDGEFCSCECEKRHPQCGFRGVGWRFRRWLKPLAIVPYETIGNQVVQQTRMQCFNCKGFGHFAKECILAKRLKEYAYHKEKMLLIKKEDARIQLQHHLKQHESVNDIYVMEKADRNITLDSFDMSFNKGEIDQNAEQHEDERVLLASLIEYLKVDIDERKKDI